MIFPGFFKEFPGRFCIIFSVWPPDYSTQKQKYPFLAKLLAMYDSIAEKRIHLTNYNLISKFSRADKLQKQAFSRIVQGNIHLFSAQEKQQVKNSVDYFVCNMSEYYFAEVVTIIFGLSILCLEQVWLFFLLMVQNTSTKQFSSIYLILQISILCEFHQLFPQGILFKN